MDSMKTLVLYAMIGSMLRKGLLSGGLNIPDSPSVDEHAQNVLNPKQHIPKPSRADISAAACKNFKHTMHLLSKGTK